MNWRIVYEKQLLESDDDGQTGERKGPQDGPQSHGIESATVLDKSSRVVSKERSQGIIFSGQVNKARVDERQLGGTERNRFVGAVGMMSVGTGREESGPTEGVQPSIIIGRKDYVMDSSMSSKIVAYKNSSLGLQEDDSLRFKIILDQFQKQPMQLQKRQQSDEHNQFVGSKHHHVTEGNEYSDYNQIILPEAQISQPPDRSSSQHREYSFEEQATLSQVEIKDRDRSLTPFVNTNAFAEEQSYYQMPDTIHKKQEQSQDYQINYKQEDQSDILQVQNQSSNQNMVVLDQAKSPKRTFIQPDLLSGNISQPMLHLTPPKKDDQNQKIKATAMTHEINDFLESQDLNVNQRMTKENLKRHQLNSQVENSDYKTHEDVDQEQSNFKINMESNVTVAGKGSSQISENNDTLIYRYKMRSVSKNTKKKPQSSLLLTRPDRESGTYKGSIFGRGISGLLSPSIKDQSPKSRGKQGNHQQFTDQRVPIQQYLNATQHGQVMMLRNRNQSRSLNRRRELQKSVNVASRKKSLNILQGSHNETTTLLDTSASAQQILFQKKLTPSHNATSFTQKIDFQNSDIQMYINDNVIVNRDEATRVEDAYSSQKRKSVSTLNRVFLLNSQLKHNQSEQKNQKAVQFTNSKSMHHQSKAILPNISFHQQEQLKNHFLNNQFQRINKSVNTQSMSNIYQQKLAGRPEQLKIQRNFYEKNSFMLTPNETAGLNSQKNLPQNLKRRDRLKAQFSIIQQNQVVKKSMKLRKPSYEQLQTQNEKLFTQNSQRQFMQFQEQHASKINTQQSPVDKKMTETQFGVFQNSTLLKSKLECTTDSTNPVMISRFGDFQCSQLQFNQSQITSGRKVIPQAVDMQPQTSQLNLGNLGESGESTLRIQKLRDISTMSQNKQKQILGSQDQKVIFSGSLAINDKENSTERIFNKQSKQFPPLMGEICSQAETKVDKLYNQKAQLAVNLSKELYKAKKILKNVIGSQSNRKSKNKPMRNKDKMVYSMKNCFVNPDLFSPTSESNYESYEHGNSQTIVNTKKEILTESRRCLDTSTDGAILMTSQRELITNIHSSARPYLRQPSRLTSKPQDEKLGQTTTKDSQNFQEQSSYLDKIVQEKTLELDSSLKQQSMSSLSPRKMQRGAGINHISKAYGEVTELPISLVKLKNQGLSRSKNQSNNKQRGKSNNKINQNLIVNQSLAESQTNNNVSKKLFNSQISHLHQKKIITSRLRCQDGIQHSGQLELVDDEDDQTETQINSDTNMQKIEQIYGPQKKPLIDLIQEGKHTPKGQQIIQYSDNIYKNGIQASILHQEQLSQKIVTPGVPILSRLDNQDVKNIERTNLSPQFHLLQEMKELEKLKKVHSEFKKLQNIGNYQGPILNQIKQIMQNQRDNSTSNPNQRNKNDKLLIKKSSKNSSVFDNKNKSNSSKLNQQYFFDKQQMIQISPTSASLRSDLQQSKQVHRIKTGKITQSSANQLLLRQKSDLNVKSGSSLNRATPRSYEITEMQKQINKMHKKIEELRIQRRREEEDFDRQNHKEQLIKSQFQRYNQNQAYDQHLSLRKQILSVKDGQLMVNTTNGEELLNELLEKEKQQSLEREKQRKLREEAVNQMIQNYRHREGIQDQKQHLCSHLKHQECRKCRESQNQKLAEVFKYKGPKPPEKYLLEQDPIEKFYTLYVKGQENIDEDKNKITMDPFDLLHGTFTHHVSCPCAKFNVSKLVSQLGNSALDWRVKGLELPSKKRQIEIIDQINQIRNPQEIYDLSRRDKEVLVMLLVLFQKCNCRERYKESLLSRMRNQKLYEQFLKDKLSKHQMFEGIREVRHKFNALKIYGYNVNLDIPLPQDTINTSIQMSKRKSSIMLTTKPDIKNNMQSKFRLGSLGPCRRTCSSIHNPMFHCKHFDVPIRQCRPQTARGNDFNEVDYDWFHTDIDLIVRRNKKELRFEQIKTKDGRELAISEQRDPFHPDAKALNSEIQADIQSKLNEKQQVFSRTHASDQLKMIKSKKQEKDIIENNLQDHEMQKQVSKLKSQAIDGTRKNTYEKASSGKATPDKKDSNKRDSSIMDTDQQELHLQSEHPTKSIPLKHMFRVNEGFSNMKIILQQLGNKMFRDKNKQNVRILTSNEVEFYYHGIKRLNIRNNYSLEEKLDLIEDAWNTLELLMKSLMLDREFEILNDSCKRKQLDIDLVFNAKLDEFGNPVLSAATNQNLIETILKVLIRLKKTYDAIELVSKIIQKIQKRETLVNQLILELEKCSNIRVKGYYFILLKLSQSIHILIERLRVDFPLLNRPFIYQNYNYCPHLIRDGLQLRKILMRTHPEIKEDLDRVLDNSGKIVPIKHIVELNLQIEIGFDEDIERGIISEEDSPTKGKKKKPLSPLRHGGCGHRHTYKLNRIQALTDREQLGFFDDLFLFAMRNPHLSLDF